MKKLKFILIGIILSVLFLFFNSCSELIDCIASTKPELNSKLLPSGYTNQNYSNFITASVKNDPNDDDYDYHFSISGNYPPGMTYFEQGRRLYFSGKANQAGTYTFKVTVTIDYPEYYDPDQGFWEDNNRICFGNDTTSKDYMITIQ